MVISQQLVWCTSQSTLFEIRGVCTFCSYTRRDKRRGRKKNAVYLQPCLFQMALQSIDFGCLLRLYIPVCAHLTRLSANEIDGEQGVGYYSELCTLYASISAPMNNTSRESHTPASHIRRECGRNIQIITYAFEPVLLLLLADVSSLLSIVS